MVGGHVHIPVASWGSEVAACDAHGVGEGATGGKGGACISVTGAPNVNPKCLTAKGLVQSSDSSAAGAIQVATTKRFRPESSIPWQGFTRLECVGVDGFYECSFISAVSGTATVMFRASGPTVIYTSLDCQGAYAGHPECTLP